MHWRFSPDIPIYIQIIEQLEQMIVSGMLSPGDRLLSVREFAAEAGVNPNTMQKALTELEKKGVVYSQRTLGRFVTDDPMKLSELREEMAQKEITSFLGAMKRLGYTRSEVVALYEQNKRSGQERPQGKGHHSSDSACYRHGLCGYDDIQRIYDVGNDHG